MTDLPRPGTEPNPIADQKEAKQTLPGWYLRWGKRLIDLTLASSAIILLSPMLALIAVLVLLKQGRPVLFWHVRPGLHGQPFKLVKFRTMTNQTDAKGELLPEEQRVTRFGQFLRGLSLDEIPELLNVLRGDMSLVGPRPLLMDYLPLYTPEQMRRHEARPGITGWAQVNGRNFISWEQKFSLDVWYVDRVSPSLDMKILFLTMLKVLRREGVDQFEGVTAEGGPFRGSMPERDT